MESNPMLEEVWRIKDKWTSEAGNNIRRLCQATREWAPEHPHSDPVGENGRGRDLRGWASEVAGLKSGKNIIVEL
jgi:hypothetical protein